MPPPGLALACRDRSRPTVADIDGRPWWSSRSTRTTQAGRPVRGRRPHASPPPARARPAASGSRSSRVVASSGADVHDGVAALHGWGTRRPGDRRAARASCPVLLAVTGPVVSGPALLLGLADLVVMTRGRLRLRDRAPHGRRRSPASPIDRPRARRRRRPRAGPAGVAAPGRDATPTTRATLVADLLSLPAVEPRRGAAPHRGPTTRSTGPRPRPATLHARPPPPAATTCGT